MPWIRIRFSADIDQTKLKHRTSYPQLTLIGICYKQRYLRTMPMTMITMTSNVSAVSQTLAEAALSGTQGQQESY